jgi:hypothetical protein
MDTFFHFSSAKQTKLGDFNLTCPHLISHKLFITLCQDPAFQLKPFHDKLSCVFKTLTDEILAIRGSAFVLPSIVGLFEMLEKKKLLSGVLFAYYEFWLNQYSQLSPDEHEQVRGKICGKWIPRDHYQIYFPIGQNKTYFGSHFVTAHSSPDLDTTVASFWGWVDAFGAKVSSGLHHWNVPGGAPHYQVEFKLIFDEIFSPYLFSFCAKHRGALQLSALELLTQKDMIRCPVQASSLSIDVEKNSQAVVLVDQHGYYQGDWKSVDVEGVRQVVMLVNQTLRHFENHFQQELIALFSKEDLKRSDLLFFIKKMLAQKLDQAEPLKEISDRQRKYVSDYLKDVLNVDEGLSADIKGMAKGFAAIKITRFETFVTLIQGDLIEGLFDKTGALKATRSELFQTLDQIIKALDAAIHTCRHFVDQLYISLQIKSKVFGYKPLYVSEKADVEEMRLKMGNSAYLTVTMSDEKGTVPIGVVYASDLYKSTLGTVTLRDFSNREETKVPSYLEVISCIDHHKSQLSGLTPATIYVSDAQSSNTQVAKLAFSLNDLTSTGGMSEASMYKQLEGIDLQKGSSSEKRIAARLLTKLEAHHKRGSYYIDPLREYIEYYHFLFAILDDTDLLSKVSYQDVYVVKELLNRMKTILEQQEVEVVHFDDLSQGPDFVCAAAARLLRQADLYSITKKIYKSKETFIDQLIEKAALKQDMLFFADTKEQNGCVRIGQFKLYPINYNSYKQYSNALKKTFIEESYKLFLRKKEIDLHIFMVSTLIGLEGLYEKSALAISHFDEIWIYVPDTQDGGMTHVRSFFNSFLGSSDTQAAVKKVTLLGHNELLDEVIKLSILTQVVCPYELLPSELGGCLIVIEVVAGSMNSRKAMITPYLPKLVT